jgi:hypothetical protein
MRLRWTLVCSCFVASTAFAQIQVELRFPRLQYISYEPVVANLVITNLAGRDVDLRDADGQSWFGLRSPGTKAAPSRQYQMSGPNRSTLPPANVLLEKSISRRCSGCTISGPTGFALIFILPI